MAGADAENRLGNALPLKAIPTGTLVHNIELKVGRGGQIVRSAGSSAQVLAKEDKYTLIRLPSGEMRQVLSECMATVGQVSAIDHKNVKLGKAGRRRNMGLEAVRTRFRDVPTGPSARRRRGPLPHRDAQPQDPVG